MKERKCLYKVFGSSAYTHMYIHERLPRKPETFLRAFSKRCVFHQQKRCLSVDRRPKQRENNAFSNDNALVWT